MSSTVAVATRAGLTRDLTNMVVRISAQVGVPSVDWSASLKCDIGVSLVERPVRDNSRDRAFLVPRGGATRLIGLIPLASIRSGPTHTARWAHGPARRTISVAMKVFSTKSTCDFFQSGTLIPAM